MQDRLFASLERLETKDTQHAAVQELTRLIRVGGHCGMFGISSMPA